MKFQFYTILLLTAIFTYSCDNSSSNEFEEANGDVAIRLIKNITVLSVQDATENKSIDISYDGNKRISNISNGMESNVFVYDSGNLTNITGSGETFNIENLFESPHAAFEVGEVLEYDGNANPKKIKFLEEEYDYESDSYVTKKYIANMFYDDKPSPYFYTLKAGGIIGALDNIKLNLNMAPQAAKLVQAKMMLPVNNINKVEYVNNEGVIVGTIKADYVYDDTNYPNTATVTTTTEDDISVYTVTYLYNK